MGTDKASIEIGGVTLARRAAAALAQVTGPTLEVGPARTALPTVADPGIGPLGALAAGWEALSATGTTSGVLVLACDLPLVNAPLLQLLADHRGEGTVVPVAGGRPQPLCARWSPATLARAAGLTAGGERRVLSLLALDPAVTWLDEAAWAPVGGPHALDDADTPDELERLRGLVAPPPQPGAGAPSGP
jgi:molybdopterin-guanine dinucleotide biosynthesis protein A